MSRTIKVAAAQLGPVHLTSKREETLERMITLLESAVTQGVHLVLFPECAFTTFFPRHLINDQQELDTYFEHNDDLLNSPNTKPLFDKAKHLGVDISVGYAERTSDGNGYNTAIYYSSSTDSILSKYRKVHLPGTAEPFANPDAVSQLEKRYFTPGNLGFKAFRVTNLISSALKRTLYIKPTKKETQQT